MTMIRTFAAAVLALALSAGSSFAASDFVGQYKTTDTEGKPMQITLSEDGTATGQRAEESLSGKWKEKRKGNTAIIRWNDGWITQITKSGDAYSKVAYKKGNPDEAEKSAITKIE